MSDIFAGSPMNIPIPDGEITYHPGFFSFEQSDHFLKELIEQSHWTNRSLTIQGKSVPMPRLIAWHADPGIIYEYSNGASPHNPWTETLLAIKSKTETAIGTYFNGVLLNYYRNGQDSMGWHSDNEQSLSDKPIIASISFGCTRSFELKHKYKRNQKKLKLDLQHGSLLVMQGDTQKFWQHCIAKNRHIDQPRVNLTFRYVKN